MDNAPAPSSTVYADGNTAFVLGNGPSLDVTSLFGLNHYATIGMNAAFYDWRQIGWRPHFYICIDPETALGLKDEIAALITEDRIKKLMLCSDVIDALGATARTNKVINFEALQDANPLLAVTPMTTGSQAALWAGAMGYTKVVSLGVDLRFGDPKQKALASHHLSAWRHATVALQAEGIETYNANIRSAVQCQPYVNLARLLGNGDEPAPAAEKLAPKTIALAQNFFSRALSAVAPCIAVCLATFLLMYFIFVQILGVTSEMLMLLGGGAALAFMVVLSISYLRFMVSDKIADQNRQIKALRARLSDFERRYD